MTDKPKPGVNITVPNYQVSGTVRIIDKDGNVKSEMDIVSLEVNEAIQEDIENAIK